MNVVQLATVAILLATGFIIFTFTLAFRDPNMATINQKTEYETSDPLLHCVTPFQTLLGVADHVPAFSNCNTALKSTTIGFVRLNNPMDVSTPYDYSQLGYAMTASRYGSMDFVMRWMAFNRGLMPQLLEDPQQWWKASYFYNPAKTNQDWNGEFIDNYMEGTNVEERKYVSPRRADIVAYSANSELGFKQGHAAIIVKVEDDVEAAGGREQLQKLKATWQHPRKVYLAEQNLHNADWGGKNYSRVAFFKWSPTQSGALEGYLEDDTGLHILGRMRVGKMRELRHHYDRYQDALDAPEDL